MNRARIIQECIDFAKEVPFKWDAQGDCLGWANLVAWRLTGKDLAKPLRGRYASQLDAQRVMRQEGWKSLSDVVASLGLDPIPPAMGQNGDWAIVINEDGTDTIGVFCNEWVFAKSLTGMARVSRLNASGAFRI